MYRTGLVIGKFSPLHLGHEFLINTALKKCEEVIVISYSQPELDKCDAAERRRWFELRFPDVQVLVVDDEMVESWDSAWYGVPPNDASERTHRIFCSWVCLKILYTMPDAIFSSESYGDGFAEVMMERFKLWTGMNHRVDHVLVDIDRQAFPISGTDIRKDFWSKTKYLSRPVAASFVPRILLLGGESSGKTTLALALADELNCMYVEEFGRKLHEQRAGKLFYQDMLKIAQWQVETEYHRAGDSVMFHELGTDGQYIICDTSPLTTLWYSLEMFPGITPDPELYELAKRKYDHIFLCDPNIPFDQDGTRRDEAFRREGHEWYIDQLNKRGMKYTLVTGSVQERVQQVKEVLNGKIQHNDCCVACGN